MRCSLSMEFISPHMACFVASDVSTPIRLAWWSCVCELTFGKYSQIFVKSHLVAYKTEARTEKRNHQTQHTKMSDHNTTVEEVEDTLLEDLRHHISFLLFYILQTFARQVEKVMEKAGKTISIPRDFVSVHEHVPIMVAQVNSMPMGTIAGAQKRTKLIQEMLHALKYLEKHVDPVLDAYATCIKEKTVGAKELWDDKQVQKSLEIYQIMFDQVDAVADREEQADKLANEQMPWLADLAAASIAAAPKPEDPEAEAERIKALEAEARRVKAGKRLEEMLRNDSELNEACMRLKEVLDAKKM